MYELVNMKYEPIVLLLTSEYIIKDINCVGAKEFFQRDRSDVINKSFIDLLFEQKIAMEEWVAALNLSRKTLFKSITLHHSLEKEYDAIIIALKESDQYSYTITMTASNNLYQTYLYSIINNLPGAVYWKDRSGRYLGCNQFVAMMAGYDSPNQMIGKTDYDFCWHESAEDWQKLDNKVISENITIVHEEKTKLTDGKTITKSTYKRPLTNEKGDIIGLIGTSLDMTDRKTLEEELRIANEASEAASRAKTQFIANMGHDIRMPLTGIIGMSSLLKDEVKCLEEKEKVSIIHQSGEQLLGLLNGVLNLITVDTSNENNVLEESFNLRRLIQDVIDLERPAVIVRQLKILVNIDDTIPSFVISDKIKLHRIILNLVSNAIKFTKRGHIEINAQLVSRQNDEVKVQFFVKDTGIGISDELQDKVFDRFFKVSPSYKGLYTGNGLGLYIVQKYVDLLGGDIQLISTFGVGTTFSFVLSMRVGKKTEHEILELVPNQPLANELDESSLQVSKPISLPIRTVPINSHQIQILLVEDNVPALKVLTFMVEKFDVQVTQAVDAETALDLVRLQHFDLVITDLGLPGQSGDEMTTVIRAYEKEHNLKPMVIVGLTGHASNEIRQVCLGAGMNELYIKPMLNDVLTKLLQKLRKPSDVKAVIM